MIDVQTLIAKLDADTSYTITAAKYREPEFQEVTELPIIYVGYNGISSKDPHSPVEKTIFNSVGEDLVQSFEIQIVCEVANFSGIWKTIYATLIGYNPVESEKYHSGFTYARGGVMGLSNGKLWHVDVWNIGFPILIPLI